MDMEVSSLGADLRKELRLKMRRYKADTDDMRKRFLKAEGDLMDFKNRENLMGGLEVRLHDYILAPRKSEPSGVVHKGGIDPLIVELKVEGSRAYGS
jgi:hypothetical protein